MSQLNKDCLFMIFNELENDRLTLYSCLFINREWCENVVPVLWKHPWQFFIQRDYLYYQSITINEWYLFKTILLHLWEESHENLNRQKIKLFNKSTKKPLFNYVGYCKYLDFSNLNILIDETFQTYDETKCSIIKVEILKMFIRKTRIINFTMPRLENFRLQLFPGIDNWLSDIECLTCDSNINQETFIELARLCKSIKSLNIFLGNLNNPGLFRFIKVQKQLHEIGFSLDPTNNDIDFCSFHQTFRDALTANANTIQHFKLTHGVLFPFSVLSSLVNLKSLYVGNRITYDFWSDLEICSFPNLVKLVTYKIPLEKTARMIENSTSKLIEIIIEYTIYHQAYYDRCIQAICQTCPRLKYFKIIVKMTDDFYKLRDILQNCHYLEGLVIEFPYSIRGWNYNIIKVDEVDNTDSDIDEESEYSLIEDEDDCKILCEILAKYSPMCLYKFKLQNMKTLTTDNLKIFFDNWKDRPPMLLQTMPGCRLFGKHFDLIREYTEKGVIKKYDNILNMEDNYDYFEWK